MEHERRAVRTFTRRAARYTTSPTHTDPGNLARLVELAAPRAEDRVLDIGTGTGHTALALAPHAGTVIGLDLTRAMLGQARGLAAEAGPTRVAWSLGDAHALPFPDGSFDLVTCRRTAHHFTRIGQALAEMRRVLAPGGRLVLDDRSVPEDDAIDEAMNRLDALHDPSHVQQYRPSRWRALLEDAGFAVDRLEPYERDRPFSSLTRNVPDARVVEQYLLVDGLASAVRERMGLVERDGVLHVRHWYLLVRASR